MFPIDKKKTAMLIISKMGKEQEVKDESEISSDDSSATYKAFAEDMLQAISDKSVVDLSNVLKSFHEMIEEQDEVEDSKQ
jgi:hypothetical protein